MKLSSVKRCSRVSLRAERAGALLLLTVFGLMIAQSAPARSFWLLPSETVFAAAGEWVTVDGGASTAPFENSKFPLELAQLRITAPDGSALAPQNALTGKLRSVFDLQLEQSGTYRLAVLDDSAFAIWTDPASGSQDANVAGEGRRWRGTVSELAQAVPADAQDLQVGQMLFRTEVFITVGEPGPIPAAPREHAGKGLELVPRSHPNDLVPDEEAVFGFLINGEPAADLTVSITPGGFRWRDDAGVIELKTDAQGLVRVSWPGPGQYLIYAAASVGSSAASVGNAGANTGNAVASAVTAGAPTSPQARAIQGATRRELFYAGTLEVLP